jgi:hypothetical protein
MTGITCIMAGSALSGPLITTGSASLTVKGSTTYWYGYDGAAGGTVGTFGSITNGTFSTATVKAVFSTSPVNTIGQANSYSVIFDGNRSAGFFNTLTINGTLVSGTLGAPSYSAGNDETTFAITVTAAATLFGTTDGVSIPISMT